jgi:succinoglycan biosynthesis protein ExoU
MFSAKSPLPETLSAESFVLGNLPDYENPRRSMGFLKPLMRRAFLRQNNLGYDESMRFAEDYKLYLESLLLGGLWLTAPAAHYIYVVRDNSLTATHKAEDLAKLCAVDRNALRHAKARAEPGLRKALRRHLVSSQQRLHWVLFYTSLKAHRLGQAVSSVTVNVPVFLFILQNCFEQLRIRTSTFMHTRLRWQ